MAPGAEEAQHFAGPFLLLERPLLDGRCVYCSAPTTAANCAVCSRPVDVPWLTTASVTIRLGSRLQLSTPPTPLEGVVVAVDVYAKYIELLTGVQSQPLVQWKLQRLRASVLPSVEVLSPESPWHAILDSYGFCGDCRSPYRIGNAGQLRDSSAEHSVRANVAKKERLRFYEAQRQALLERKAAARAAHAPSRTLVELSAKLRDEAINILRAKRDLEPVQVACPHCGWTPLPSAGPRPGAATHG
ncbi:hypothetical protein SPRG_15433 [Saprolegnia parasitica CBS 223.65]|uniref:Uncharacterized protein n=1 Tax=Saprolegnia parasitica (strain CBS 223.65) TaxID=695850 RepID=A0A067BMJ5_SAPPC|nr:hypothetical protein SPRG_15433 [Saprolegnia parasitica CBS 223.65]KDO19443.1 hypothetical protein SPRG_15433 [Saprolegnia parasitica CBS 223.65]|eukprot:XP_012209869.1 hypothetical protein SPRG_15433 [Saprolegnia parasitica CBS 223.65]